MCSLVIVFDDLEKMRILHGFAVHMVYCGFQSGEVDRAIFLEAHFVNGGEHGEVRVISKKQRRHHCETMVHGDEFAVDYSAGREHGPDYRVGVIGDVGAAVIAYQQPVPEIFAYLIELFRIAHQDAFPAIEGFDVMQ